jgi:hypothetical protein
VSESLSDHGWKIVNSFAEARQSRELPDTPEYASPEETQEFFLAFCDQSNEKTARNRRLATAAYVAKTFEGSDMSDHDEKEELALRAIEAYNELDGITFKLMTSQARLTTASYNKYYPSLFLDTDEENDNA